MKTDRRCSAFPFVRNTDTFLLCSELPNDEKFGLKSQMQRTAISIPSNIAEGSGRNSKKEFSHFLTISTGSAYELETQIELSFRIGFIASSKANELSEKLQSVQKMLYKLQKSLLAIKSVPN